MALETPAAVGKGEIQAASPNQGDWQQTCRGLTTSSPCSVPSSGWWPLGWLEKAENGPFTMKPSPSWSMNVGCQHFLVS